jgi:short-subunit dehydrogenase
MPYFQNKVVWITGASSGIGEALAYALSGAGARVIISSRRLAELERVKAGCPHPENVKTLVVDLEDSSLLAAQTQEAIAMFGKIDIMVHNGGISQRSFVRETDLTVHRKLMEVDYFSYVEISKNLLPHFIQNKAGHFVVISSVMGKIGTPMRSAYAAAKHALHGFFDCLRAEVSGDNIQVTIITPGYIRTEISLHAVTGSGERLGVLGKDIGQGFPAHKAAEQILKAVARGRFESYVGRASMEKFALVLNRLAPGLLKRMAPRQVPK